MPVFVHVVQLVEHPQWTFALPVPSVVRLQLLDLFSEVAFERPDRGASGSKPLASFGAATENVDRESGLLADIDIPSRITEKGQFADQLIEGRPEVVGDLPNEQRAINEGQFLEISDAKRICLGFLIELGWNNSIGMG
jgi:hypothetical protein